MIKLNSRDERIISFLKNVRTADTQTIYILFFADTCGYRTYMQRINKLVQHKYIKRFRESVIEPYKYYVGTKPINYKHKLLFSKTLAFLKENECTITKYKTPLKLDNMICDGYVEVIYKNKNYYILIENELSKKLDIKKLEQYYFNRNWRNIWDTFPVILCTTSKPSQTSKYLKVVNVKNDKLALQKLYNKIRQNNDVKTTL